MVVNNSKFVVWPLRRSVPGDAGHCFTDKPLCCGCESDETKRLLCCDHEMQPLCCLINLNKPLNEGDMFASDSTTYTNHKSGIQIPE